MDRIVITGVIGSGDPAVVEHLLASWLKKPDGLKARTRLQGAEIRYQDDTWELHCYNDTGGPEFLLEASLSGTLEQANASLTALGKLCRQKGLSSQLEYVQENEDGEEISEQFSVTG